MNARQTAFRILQEVDRGSAYADDLLDRALDAGTVTGPDRGFLTELVYGTLRRQGTLDHVISTMSSTKPAKLERSVLIALRLGLYQLLFLDRVPPSAAVNETVQLVKQTAPRASGLVNAVLRRTDRERETITFPAKEADPAAYIAARHSAPLWLAKMWLDQLGEIEAEALAAAMAEPAPLTIRANTLRCTRDNLVERLLAEGVETRFVRFAPDALQVTSHQPVGALLSFREGLFTVQDESSQLAALLLAPKPGEAVLDVCAAPGGKTTYLAQLMRNTGSIVAGDRTEKKLRLIRETATRLGIDTIEAVLLDASDEQSIGAATGGRTFDRVLIDAPCSALGVIRRNPEGRWRKTPDDILRLAVTQRRVLQAAATQVREGGVVLYSTCSTSIEENERVVEDFLSRNRSFVLEDIRSGHPLSDDLASGPGYFRSWPHRHGMDGFFAARIRRTG